VELARDVNKSENTDLIIALDDQEMKITLKDVDNFVLIDPLHPFVAVAIAATIHRITIIINLRRCGYSCRSVLALAATSNPLVEFNTAGSSTIGRSWSPPPPLLLVLSPPPRQCCWRAGLGQGHSEGIGWPLAQS
jgi:hypothetical protein